MNSYLNIVIDTAFVEGEAQVEKTLSNQNIVQLVAIFNQS